MYISKLKTYGSTFSQIIEEILLKIGDTTMFLGDFILYESEQMSLADVQYYTKMINIFSESAVVLAGPTKSLDYVNH